MAEILDHNGVAILDESGVAITDGVAAAAAAAVVNPANLRLYYDDKFAELDPSADITVSGEVATLPKTNLQQAFRTRVWRYAATSGWVKWDFGATENCQYIALINHNLTAEGALTVVASQNSDLSSPVYQETFDAWEPVMGFGEGGFGDVGFGGYLPDDQIADLAAGPIRILDFGETVEARYWRISLADSGNPDGSVEIGRLMTGLYWEPERQFRYDWDITPIDDSEIAYSEGGQAWTDTMPKRYQVDMELPVTDADKWWYLMDLLRRWGVRKDLLLQLFPDGDPAERFFTTIYGRFETVPAVGAKYRNYHEVKLSFLESL